MPLLFWVITMITPLGMDNIPLSALFQSQEECMEQASTIAAPYPVRCLPEELAEGDMA